VAPMRVWFQQWLQDLRFGIRTFVRTPGFTTLAVLSLALGIMATTAMYSVIHAVVLDPFPYKDVDALMSVRVWDPAQRGSRTGYSTDQFLEIAERNTIFEGTIASTISDILWTGDGDPQRLRGNYGTPNTFLVMGVPALLGRPYLPDDGRPEAAPVVVLGYRFWQRQFGGDPSVVGRQLRLNGKVRTVVGVMPKRFMWRGADVYLPVVFARGSTSEGIGTVHLLGRLKPGVTEARAEADLNPIVSDLARRAPTQFPQTWRVGLLSFKETFPSSIRDDLWVLFGAVGLLLLIACANVSNLLLSKAAARQREMAVRAALGGSRLRLLRQLLTESLILAVAGGIAGTALAYGALRAILTLVPPNTIPDESEVALNLPVLLFALAISAATSVLFGLAPALHTLTRDLANPLRSSGRNVAGGTAQALLRKGLVVAAVSLSIMLMVGASLMVRTVLAIGRVELGFRPDRVLTLRVPLPDRKYPDPARRVVFFQEALRSIASVPGVTAAAVNTTAHPFGNPGWPVEVPGMPAIDRPLIMHQVSEDYTKALGIPLVKGRLFTSTDVEARRQVALVNEAFERTRLEAGAAAVGLIVRIPRLKQPPIGASGDAVEIVGVVSDTLNRGITDELLPEIYIPYSLAGAANRVVVQTAGDPAGVTRAVVERIYKIDAEQPVTEVRTIGAFLDDFIYAGPRFNVVLLSVFAGLGLALAVVGVYGVMSHAVAQQTREIGVRIALGAEPGSVARMVMKSGAALLMAGIAVGLAGSLFAARLLAQQVWQVSTFDPISFIAVSAVLLVAGLQACAWPAWRAARTQPIVALRQE
jgi:putative ABC transport system permease protein